MKPRWLPLLLAPVLAVWACSRDATQNHRPATAERDATIEEATGPPIFADVTERSGIQFILATARSPAI